MNRVALVLALGVLTGCTSWFGAEDKTPLPGERVSILTLGERLAPTDEAGDAVVLAEAVNVAAWSQQDANAENRPPHSAYSGALDVQWSVALGNSETQSSRILSQPVVASEHLYFLDADAQVIAFSLDARRVVWTRSVRPDGEDGRRAAGGGVAVDGDTVFVTTGYGEVLALHGADGAVQWRRSYGVPIRAAPTIQGARVYAGLVTDHTLALQRADGSEIWSHEGTFKQGPSLLNALASAANDDVVIAPYSTGEIVALRADNGREAWRVPLVDILQGASRIEVEDVAGGPVIDGDAVIAGGTTGLLGSFGLTTGVTLWQVPLSISQTPRVVGDWLYTLTTSGEVLCLRRSNGNVRWRVGLADMLDTDEDELAWSGLVIAGGAVIVAGTKRILSLDAENGSLLRSVEIPGSAASAPVVAGGTLYVLTREGMLVSLR